MFGKCFSTAEENKVQTYPLQNAAIPEAPASEEEDKMDAPFTISKIKQLTNAILYFIIDSKPIEEIVTELKGVHKENLAQLNTLNSNFQYITALI